MAQDMRSFMGKSNASGGSGKNSKGDTERAQTADFTAGDAADFQVSLASATSIAGLTAFATPLPELSTYVSDEAIAADTAAPLAHIDQVADSTNPAPPVSTHKENETTPSDATSAPLTAPLPAQEKSVDQPKD